MSKIDEVKERINYLKSFLTIIFGMLVLVIGGLINLYLKNHVTEIFWIGFVIIIILLVTALKVMFKIEVYLKKLGEL